MKIPLSKRLLTCCDFVEKGARVADIGCDHGYLSIYLLANGIASSAIASDVREMPLQSAKKNAEKYGLQDKIQFFLSDGVQNLPRDFDTMVCAGMGADTMCAILDAASWLKDAKYKMILQCQSKTPMLRKYLSDHGWHISRETVLRDGRFLYTVMEVRFDPDAEKLSEEACYFSPALAADAAPEKKEYLRWVIRQLEISISGTGDAEKSKICQTLKAWEEML